MTPSSRSPLLALAGALALCGVARAQSDNAAFLFAYDIDRGKEEAFEAGYAAHLAWHADHADALPWYGWYVTSGPRTGLFIDDTKVTTTGGTLDAEGFESGLGPWTIAGAPAGSPGNASEFVRSQAVIDWTSATVTRDSVLFGFGLEQVATTAERNTLMGEALEHLLD